MKKIIIVFIILFTSGIMLSQQVYKVPLASKGNIIELQVENSSEVNLENLEITASVPDWIVVKSMDRKINEIAAESETIVNMLFDIKRSAPITTEGVIEIKIAGSTLKWIKNIGIEVGPPEEYKLEQNYPNPFNPATTISYQLPYSSKVNLGIYNLLGQQVEVLINKVEEAGLHEIQWSAANLSSGMYIYKLNATSLHDLNNHVFIKKMMYLK